VKTKLIIFCLCALAATVWFAGCAASAKEQSATSLLPEIDVVQVKENSDQALKIAQEAKMGVDAINTKLTELDNKIILLGEEVSSVSIAKIEELENRQALLVEAFKDLQAQISAIEVMPQVRAGRKPGSTATFNPSSSEGILKTTSEYESYNNGLKAFNSRNYEQAIGLFNETLTKYPNGTYGDNCQYWIGEGYYAMGDFASAIGAFKKVFAYANSSKADDAQLKIGLCHLKLGQYGPAKLELQALIERYPGSEYVGKAKKYLAEIK
jgi:tol-pal system protein YbgF